MNIPIKLSYHGDYVKFIKHTFFWAYNNVKVEPHPGQDRYLRIFY